MILMLRNISHPCGLGLCALSVVSAFVWECQPFKETVELLASNSMNTQ